MLKETFISPDVSLDTFDVGQKKLHVVRDDLLKGGTKQRAAVPYLRDLMEEGYTEFIYASPFSGFAQVALAYSCQAVGASCTLFCEPDPKTGTYHTFTLLAMNLGAKVHLVKTLAACEKAASEFESLDSEFFKIPLGFDDPRYREHLASSLDTQWKHLCNELGHTPHALWISLGSGTLTRVLNEVLPSYVDLHCVDVHVLDSKDDRIQAACRPNRVHYHSAPEVFHEIAKAPPPLPSNAFYDAKVWQFVSENSLGGDVWWNVAR
ncbi:MAG: hypothetical protein V4692_10410 [Bdellovibrionota bacterium]